MDARTKETLVIRLTSVGYFILALAVFKPFGLDALAQSRAASTEAAAPDTGRGR